MKPRVCILRTDGTNCDGELYYAFEKFGGTPDYVHVNELRTKNKSLANYQILALPGGFSYGDDIASGKILAVELTSFFSEELTKFIDRPNTLLIGICNGFQTLIRTGLLPFRNIGEMDATLTNNDSGHFECRWIKLKGEKSRCVFLKDTDKIIDLAVNHGEGKFLANTETLKKIEAQKLVVFRYVDDNGRPTQKYPENPNGSINAIAGICDPTGRILGLMPHPEKFVDITQYPNWRRNKILRKAQDKPHGAFIFEKMIEYVKRA